MGAPSRCRGRVLPLSRRVGCESRDRGHSLVPLRGKRPACRPRRHACPSLLLGTDLQRSQPHAGELDGPGGGGGHQAEGTHHGDCRGHHPGAVADTVEPVRRRGLCGNGRTHRCQVHEPHRCRGDAVGPGEHDHVTWQHTGGEGREWHEEGMRWGGRARPGRAAWRAGGAQNRWLAQTKQHHGHLPPPSSSPWTTQNTGEALSSDSLMLLNRPSRANASRTRLEGAGLPCPANAREAMSPCRPGVRRQLMSPSKNLLV